MSRAKTTDDRAVDLMMPLDLPEAERIGSLIDSILRQKRRLAAPAVPAKPKAARKARKARAVPTQELPTE
jgi:hypothetical protein